MSRSEPGRELSRRISAAWQVDNGLVTLHWQIRRLIVDRQAEGWGTRVIACLAEDLRAEFPMMRGLFGAQPRLHALLRRVDGHG